jgi:polysaccharide export outer membrane protein
LTVFKLILISGLVVSACTTVKPYVWADRLPAPPAGAEQSQALQIGDHVFVSIQGQDTMGGDLEVRPGGDILMPAAGRFQAVGKTVDMLAAEISARLRGILENPRVTVVLGLRKPPNVTVIGEVKTPGRYDIREGDGVLETLARAGGLTDFAAEDDIYLIRRERPVPRVRFRYDDLVGAEPASARIKLADGDIVVVE